MFFFPPSGRGLEDAWTVRAVSGTTQSDPGAGGLEEST